jgi:hypothetical protein
MSDNPNPGNFSNRPHEEVENIARKGGQSSHQSGFASMDSDKQVSKSILYLCYNIANLKKFFRRTLPRKADTLQVGALSREIRELKKQAGREVNHPGSRMNRWLYYHVG